MPREGFLARVLGRPPKEHFRFAVQNLVAATRIGDIPDDAILGLLERYRPDAREAQEEMKGIYTIVLRHFSRDLELTDAEVSDLRRLKILFGLSDEDVVESERNVLDPYYESTLQEMLKDRRLSAEERGRLEQLAKRLRLPVAVSEKIKTETMTDLVQRVLNSSIADRRLSPDEEAELKAISESLQAKITDADLATREALDYFRLLWRLEQGELPGIHPEIQLRKGEICHAASEVTHAEYRKVTKSVGYGGPVARVRIMKGLYYRVGHVNVNRVSEDVLQELDAGMLYLTSRRVIFNGSKRNVSLPLGKILNFIVHPDGLQIEKETGRDLFLRFFSPDPRKAEIWGAMLKAAMRRNQLA
jgi:hypothetical protein